MSTLNNNTNSNPNINPNPTNVNPKFRIYILYFTYNVNISYFTFHILPYPFINDTSVSIIIETWGYVMWNLYSVRSWVTARSEAAR